MAAKKSRDNSGGKKVFSVPVGKLRIKYATTGRNSSNSGSASGSVSAHRHKLLLRNNRELARSLSVQKERYRMMMVENLDLKTLNHEIKLEVLGLEKKLRESANLNSAYRDSLKGHLLNAIGCSSSLVESLNLLAVSVLGRNSESEDPSPKNSVSHEPSVPVGCVPPQSTCSAVASPLKQRVNPMISGHTIRYPTISLKRVVMDSENKVADTRKASTEEEEEEQDTENDEDVSHLVGLSTCIEEEEEKEEESDNSEDDGVGGGDEQMESDEEEDSIRRKIISFRCSVKDGERSDCEVGTTSGSIHSSRNMTRERSSPERRTSCESEAPKLPASVKSTKIIVRDNCGRRTPFVALNDVGKLLQNSRSINVMKIPLGDHNPNSAEMEIGMPNHATENGNDKFPKQSLANKDDVRVCGESARSQISMENGEDKGGSSDSKSVGRGSKCLEGTRKPEASSIAMDDPLEGTSWMHLNKFSGNKNKRKHKGSQRVPKHKKHNHEEATTAKSEADKNVVQKIINQLDKCASSGETVDSVVEETSNVRCNSVDEQQTKVNESCSRKTSDGDLDGDADDWSCSFSSKDNLLVQSTPVHKEKKPQSCCELPQTTLIVESPRKSSSDSDHSGLDGSSKGDSSHSVDEEGEKESYAVPYDSKMNRNAFVTVRVRRLVLPDLSPVNDMEGTERTGGSSLNHHPTPPHHYRETGENLPFIGFDGVCVADECSNVQALRQTISSVTDEYLVSDIGLRITGSSSAYTYGSSCDSMPSESESCDALDDTEITGGRPRRKAAPKELKEASLHKKLRRETTGPKKKPSKRKVRRTTKEEC